MEDHFKIYSPVFHVERFKYAPLKDNYLLFFGEQKKLAAKMVEVSEETGQFFLHADNWNELEPLIDESNKHFLIAEETKVSTLPAEKQALLKQQTNNILLLSSDEDNLAKSEYETLDISGLEAEESVMFILDKMLEMLRTDIEIDEQIDPVNFNYLKSTFSDQKNRYQQLIEVMLREFTEASEAIKKAIETQDADTFRSYKHKLQPSANYLRLTDLINVMEAVKQNFDQLDEKRNKHLAIKMMKYFDTILEALEQEKS